MYACTCAAFLATPTCFQSEASPYSCVVRSALVERRRAEVLVDVAGQRAADDVTFLPVLTDETVAVES